MDPKCQSQDQNTLVSPTTQRKNKKVVLLRSLQSCLLEKRWQADANQQAEECYETGSLVSRIGGSFSLSGGFSLLVCLEVPLLYVLRSEGLRGGRAIFITHRIQWGFLWTKLSF